MNNIQYIHGLRVSDIDGLKYVEKSLDESKIYDYLESRGFSFYLEPSFNRDNKSYYEYIDEYDIPIYQKGEDLAYILSLLHNKTTSYKDVVIDSVKAIYEDVNERLDYLEKYYNLINDEIDEIIFYSPDQYLLIRNISYVYQAISFSRNCIKSWYDLMIKNKTERVVLLHGNVSLDHFLDGDKKVLINFKDSNRGSPVYDFFKYYRKHCVEIDMISIYRVYQNKFKYYDYEELLLFSLISIPDKLSFSKDYYTNTYYVDKFVTYLKKTGEFISQYYQKYQKANKDKFEEENNGI